MAVPGSSIALDAVYTDAAGNAATLAVQPTGFSGIGTTGPGGALPTSTMAVVSTGGAVMAAVSSNNNVSVTVDTTTGLATTDSLNFLNVEGKLTVGPNTVSASTNNGTTSEVSVIHDVGYVNTLNANGSPNSNYTRQSANRVSRYSGIGVLTDAQAGSGRVTCIVPFGGLPLGDNVLTCYLDIVMLAKCTVASTGFGQRPVVGDTLFQKAHAWWVNVNGSIAPAPGGGFTNDYTVDDTRGTTWNQPSVGTVFTLLINPSVAVSGSNLVITMTSGNNAVTHDVGLFGTTAVQIFCTASFN